MPISVFRRLNARLRLGLWFSLFQFLATLLIAALLMGRHDFAAFGSPMRVGGSTVRQVLRTHWQAEADEFRFEVWANAFLYRMVRRMVWVQVAMAHGLIQAVQLQAALQHQTALPAGLAAAQGLTLVRVQYDGQDGTGQVLLDTLPVSE